MRVNSRDAFTRSPQLFGSSQTVKQVEKGLRNVLDPEGYFVGQKSGEIQTKARVAYLFGPSELPAT